MSDKYLEYLNNELVKEERIRKESSARTEAVIASRATYIAFQSGLAPHAAEKPEKQKNDKSDKKDLPLRGKPTVGRDREVHESLFANPRGLTRSQIRGITGRDAQDVNTVLDRGIVAKTVARSGEVFSHTEKGRENMKRSAPYAGEIKNFVLEQNNDNPE